MSDTVEIGQIRQRRLGDARDGTVPFKIMAKDWIFTDTWIVQDIVGGVSRMNQDKILECPIAHDLMPPPERTDLTEKPDG